MVVKTPDFDGDGSVGFPDFLQFARVFGTSQKDADFDAKFDLDDSGSVGFPDFLQFAQAFGKPLNGSDDGFNLVGTWAVASIAGDPIADGAAMSTWTFRSDGTYDWFFTPFEWAGGGNYSLDGSVLTVDGILAQTIGGGTQVTLTPGDNGDSFSFPDPDGDRWVYTRS